MAVWLCTFQWAEYIGEYVSTFRLLRIFIEDGEGARLRFETKGRRDSFSSWLLP